MRLSQKGGARSEADPRAQLPARGAGLRRGLHRAAVFAEAGLVLGPAGASVAAQDDAFSVETTAVADSFVNLAPGDDVSWFVTLGNHADFDMSARLRLESFSLGALMTDADNGFQARVMRCDVQWTSARSPVCAGAPTVVVDGPLAVIQGGYDLPVLLRQSTAHYLVQIGFPYEAPNAFANARDDLSFEVLVGGPSSTPGTEAPPPEGAGAPDPMASTGGAELLGRLSATGVTLTPLALGALLIGTGAFVVRRSRRAGRRA